MLPGHYNIPVQDFFKSAFSVDCVVYGYDEEGLKILLIERGADPFKGALAVPGDLVYPDEDLENAAYRVLLELTGLENMYLEQLRTFGEVHRHPLGRVITVAYTSLVRISEYTPQASSWAQQARWVLLSELPELAFDHSNIVEVATQELRNRFRKEPLGFELLPDKFTLTGLQKVYEAVLGEQFDKGNFRKKVLSMNVLSELNEMQTNVSHRPAKLFEFDRDRYNELAEQGFSFAV